LPSFRPRLFQRQRAESSEIQMVGRFSRHEDIVRRIPRNIQDLPNKYTRITQLRKIYRKYPRSTQF
jgi:hypothetical protein